MPPRAAEDRATALAIIVGQTGTCGRRTSFGIDGLPCGVSQQAITSFMVSRRYRPRSSAWPARTPALRPKARRNQRVLRFRRSLEGCEGCASVAERAARSWFIAPNSHISRFEEPPAGPAGEQKRRTGVPCASGLLAQREAAIDWCDLARTGARNAVPDLHGAGAKHGGRQPPRRRISQCRPPRSTGTATASTTCSGSIAEQAHTARACHRENRRHDFARFGALLTRIPA